MQPFGQGHIGTDDRLTQTLCTTFMFNFKPFSYIFGFKKCTIGKLHNLPSSYTYQIPHSFASFYNLFEHLISPLDYICFLEGRDYNQFIFVLKQ